MKVRRSTLVGVNLLLLGLVAGLAAWPARRGQAGAGSPSADALLAASALAQSAPPTAIVRPRGQYVLVSGRLNGSASNAIYILDTANQEIVAIRWERSQRGFVGLGYRSFADDAGGAGGR